MKLRITLTGQGQVIVVTWVDLSQHPSLERIFNCYYDDGREAWLDKRQADWVFHTQRTHAYWWTGSIEVTPK